MIVFFEAGERGGGGRIGCAFVSGFLRGWASRKRRWE